MMPNPLVDSRDLRFVLFEMMGLDALSRFEAYAPFDRDAYEATLDLAEKMAVERIYPANMPGDREGARYDPVTKDVRLPAAYREALGYFNEAGLTGLSNDPAWGGMGMPDMMYRAVMEYFFAASVAWGCYVSLSVGATNLVKNFAPDELKKLCLDKMIAGRWGGTMCLTEPDAGSDVGALTTKAVRRPDGTYLVTGQKIFITGGENDLYENIIHPVLARIEGDPPGTKGISIFLVPKFNINPDGSLGKRNDMVCAGIEHKMGIRGSSTCQLSFGENGACVGYLMGGEREGMKIMFQMMNEARLDVSVEALAVAGSAYLHAASYAKTRVQGTDPLRKGDHAPCPIVRHQDVKRMLLWMKSHVEAMRMLTQLAARSTDIAHHAAGAEAREAGALLEFLIPLCKAGNSDLSWLITGEAIQVYGGAGYCADYPVEQLARDSKILAVWEGTNGIQSMDLAFRKLLLNPDQYNYAMFKKGIAEAIAGARGTAAEAYIPIVERGLARIDEAVEMLKRYREEGRLADIYTVATPLQQAFRMLAHAWMHLWSLSITGPRLEALAGGASGEKLEAIVRDNSEAAFYHGKSLSSRFYLGSEFPKFFGLVDCVVSGEGAVAEAFAEVFTGAAGA